MYVLIILTIVAIVGGVIASKLHWSSNWKFPVYMVTGMSGLVAIIMFIVLVITHWTADSSIVQYEVAKATIEASREDEMSELERAALTQTIIEINKTIASNKYWNETNFDIFVPDKLTKLEYLK